MICAGLFASFTLALCLSLSSSPLSAPASPISYFCVYIQFFSIFKFHSKLSLVCCCCLVFFIAFRFTSTETNSCCCCRRGCCCFFLVLFTFVVILILVYTRFLFISWFFLCHVMAPYGFYINWLVFALRFYIIIFL